MYTKRVSYKGSLLVSSAIRIVVVLAMLLSTFSINLGSVQAATNNNASTESRISPGMITSDDTGDGEETPEEVSAAEEEPTEEPTEEPPLLPIEEPTLEPTEEILEEPTVEPTEEDSVTTPVINVSVNSLSSFSSSPGLLSEVQTYMVSGSGLSEDLNITAPNDFLISFDEVTFDSNLTLPQIDGSVTETIIYVRFNPAEVGISDGVISHASSGVDDILVAVSGTAGYPVITATSSMTAFNQIVGSPSEEQTYIVAGNFLTSDIVVTAPEDFEISKTTGEGFDSILTFSPTDGTLADSVIFVRLNAASAKEYEASIVHTSEGAEDVQLAVSGLAEDELITAQATTITFTGEELLGCPTDSSITINIVPGSTIEYRYQYGTSSGAYSDTTSTYTATGGAPHEIVINGLTANTKYYYRMQYHIPGETDWVNRTEHSFWTQRAEGSTFAFSVTSDIHDNKSTKMQNAMTNIYNKQPDFEIDLGDTFMLDNLASQSAVNNKYLAYREAALFDKIGNSTPIFLSSGNHENEEGWNLNDTPFSIALGSIQARKAYYPTPIEDGFYTGNTDTLSAIDEVTYGDEYREDYYAWTWGDALFVVIDPFQYTMELPYNPGMAGEGTDDSKTGDQWSWTLGAEQFQWLKETLENSDAKYKFMFSHQMVGGIPDESVSGGAGYVRGGAEASAYFEWGGKNANGSEGFADERDPIDFGSTPMHQFMVENGVSAYFHGHDHQYVYEKTDDGIVYQEMPSLGMDGFGGIYEEGDHGTFETIKILPSPAHLLITVSPSETTVDYIPDSSTSGEATYSYTILPAGEDTTSPTVSIEQAASQADPTSASSVNFDVTFSESVSDFTTGDVTLSGSAGASAAEVSGSGTAYNVEVSGMTTSGTVIADVTAAVAHDAAGNPNLASISSDNSITFNESTSPGVVELDGTASAATGAANESSVSFSHTTGTGTNRLMLVGASWNSNTTSRAITSVVFTYGTEELELEEAIVQETGSTTKRFASIWYSPSEPPQNTSGTVTVTFSGSVSNGIVAGAANFAGVNLAEPFTVTNGANSTSTGTTQSVTLDSLNGNELVFDTVFIGASSPPDPTVEDGQTGLWTDTVSYTRGVASIEQAESSTVTMSWTTSSTVVWASAAVAINPAPAGTTYNLTMAANPEEGGTTSPELGAHAYAEGTVVDITATPAAGYEFDSWTGNVADPNTASTTVTMDGDKTVTANFTAIEYTLTIVSENGTVVKDPDQSTYHYGDVVTLTATPGSGYIFNNWTGDLISTDNPASITISGNNSVTANFIEPSAVVALDGTVSSTAGAANASSVSFSHTTGTGTNRLMLVGTSWNCGTTTRTISSVTFSYGTEVLNLVEEITQESNSTAQRFASIWYSPSEPPQNTTGTVTVTFSGSVSYGIAAGAANFTGVNQTTPFTVTNGANSTSKDSTQSVTLDSLNGNELVFDTVFIGGTTDPIVDSSQTQLWTVNGSNTRGVASIEQPDSSSVTMSWTTSSTVVWASAAVAINPAALGTTYNLTMAASPEEGGTTSPELGAHAYAEGTVVDITATPAAGYEFDSWTGNVADPNTASTTVTMDGDKTVTANFNQLLYTLTVGNDGLGTVTVDPDSATYTYGTTVILTPIPSDGYMFDAWTGADSGDILNNSGVYTIVMNGDKSVTATFTEYVPNVELDGTVSAATGAANESSVSFSHTTGTGTNRLMLVGASWNCGSTTRTISSVIFSYGTEELDLVEGITEESNSTAQRFASIWYSPSEPPQNTSGTVTVTFSGSVSNGIVAGAANFAEVNLAEPFTVTNGANSTSTGTTQSVTLDSLNGNELVFDTVFIGASSPPDPTVGDGQTGLWTDTVSNTRGVASIEQAESSSVTMSWTTSSTVVWASAAVAINPAPAGTTYNLTMAANPEEGGTTSPSLGAHAYAEGTVVDITATPAAGYEFDSWTGDVADANAASTTVTMDGDKTVTANFTAIEYTLTIVSENGTVVKDPDQSTYHYGDVVTLTAIPGSGYIFNNWTGDVAEPNSASSTVTIDEDEIVTANFALIEYTLTIVSVNGTVTKDPNQSTYHYGDIVTLTAIPAAEYIFSNWTGDLTGTDNPASITISGNNTVTANFLASTITFTGTELLGRPEANSIAIKIVPDADISLYYEYGTSSGEYTHTTSTVSATAGEPKMVTLSGLTANTKYYYRMRYSVNGGADWVVRSENSFHTQRASGSTYTFTITSDAHVNIMLGNSSTWINTLNDIKDDQADFEIDLGDTIAMDDGSTSVSVGDIAAAEQKYKDALPYFNIISGSTPIYLMAGNHEQQEAWHLLAPIAGSLPVIGKNAEKKYYLNPVPDSFYSGDTGTYSYLDDDQLRQDYYAWTWGDALFVVINPYWFTTTKPYTTTVGGGETDTTGSGDRWDWTLGQEQFEWLKSTLEDSSADYKFIFSHQIVGGNSLSSPDQVNYGHGGVDSANLVEWGGYNVGGTTWGWDTERPGWGSQPIHQMMVANGVTAFFHGHDHQYAYEKLDGIVYQSVPSASFSNNFGIYTTGGNNGKTIQALSSPGHLRVTVGPEETQVEYIRTGESSSAYTYDMEPGSANYNLTLAVSPTGGGTTEPETGVHAYADGTVVDITANPADGYEFDSWTGDVADVNSASTTVTMDGDKTVTANFTLSPVNEAPVLGTIGSQNVNELDLLSFVAAATDDGLPAGTLTFSLSGTVPTGASIGAANGIFSWTPAENQGPDIYSFDVCVSDGSLEDCETIAVTVNEVNLMPVMDTIGSQIVAEGELLTFTATASDSDIPANTLTFSLSGTVPTGASIGAADGVFSWTPSEDQGPEIHSFDVCVSDGSLNDCQTIAVTVSEVNIAPVLDGIGNRIVMEGELLTFTATASDSDLPANTLTFNLSGTVPTGASIGAADGVFSWTPSEDQGPEIHSFDVCVSDGSLNDCQTIAVTVSEVNIAPVLDGIGNRIVMEGELLTFTATASDSDLPANTLTFSLTGSVPTGAGIGAADGVFSWTPTEDQVGVDHTFTVRVCDDDVSPLCDTEEITVTVTESNVVPVAVDDSYEAVEDTQLVVSAELGVLVNDSDEDEDELTAVKSSEPGHGSVNLSPDGSFVYTPAENYYGSDSFTYKANDGKADSEIATVSINITGVNDLPVADPQAVTTDEDTAVIITLTGSDVETGTLEYTVVNEPANGTLSGTAPDLTYTPDGDFNGSDSFTFKVNDGTADSDIATISITINPVNDAPVCQAADIVTSKNIQGQTSPNCSDVEGDGLTYSIVDLPANGTASIETDMLTYVPDTDYVGSDSFTYKANDGLADSNVSDVSVSVNFENTMPVCSNVDLVTDEDTTGQTDPDCIDLESSELAYSIAVQPLFGTAAVVEGQLVYTPAENFNGNDSFTYTANDGVIDSEASTVTVTVNAINDAPVCADVTISTNQNSQGKIAPDCSDVDDDALTYSIALQAEHGFASISLEQLAYMPETDYSGADSFTYIANDGDADSNEATVEVTVLEVVLTTRPPSTPKLSLPKNRALVTELAPRLDWSNSKIYSGTAFDHYQVQVAIDDDFTNLVVDKDVAGQSSSEYTLEEELSANTRYYWRVRAFNAFGQFSGWSTAYYFREAMEAPELTSPNDAIYLDNLRPEFDWEDVVGASGYTIQISTRINMSSPTSGKVTESSYVPVKDLSKNKTLYWRVRTEGENGPSGWSEVRSMVTPNSPTTPKLISPKNKALVTDLMPRLDWSNSAVPNGTIFDHYQVQVATDEAFTTVVVDKDVAGQANSEYTLESALNTNTRYYWRVRAFNTLGQYGSWSTAYYFREAVEAPELDSPADGTFLDNLRPEFDWEDVAGASGYTIQISSRINMGSPTSGKVTESSYVPVKDLSKNKTLYWRVRTEGENGPSGWSEVRTMVTPNSPTTPKLSLPKNKSLVTDLMPWLDWSNSAVPNGTIFDHYQVQVATDEDFTAVVVDEEITGQTNSEYTPESALNPNTRYYWRVRAFNTLGQYGSWSTAYYFREAMEAPELNSPADGIFLDNLRPEFDWEDVEGASGYTIQISTRMNMGSPASGKATDSSYVPVKDLSKNKTLYWRVRTEGENGPSEWSEVRTMVTPNSPTTPKLILPKNKALVTDLMPRLDWSNSAVPNGTIFDHYQVQVATDEAFAVVVVDKDVVGLNTDSEYTLESALNPNTRYYWRVRAFNTLGQYSSWSTAYYFREAMEAPGMVQPEDGVEAESLQPQFEWEAVEGASSYTIQLSTRSNMKSASSKTVLEAQYSPTKNLSKGKTYYWRVRANGENGPSTWSEVRAIVMPSS